MQATMTTQESALKWIADMFEQSFETLTPETLRQDIPAWDSLGVLTLMAGLDEKFGIMLSDVELGEMSRVGDILEVLRRFGKLE